MQSELSPLDHTDIHRVLSNPRRRTLLDELGDAADTVGVWELAAAVAATETGERPPPQDAQKSVYVSLHQTHLPMLESLGIVDYDREENLIRLRRRARYVGAFMDVVAGRGVTWAELYRTVGVVGLFLTVVGIVGPAPLSDLPPLLPATAALVVLAVATSYQLWRRRWSVLATLRTD